VSRRTATTRSSRWPDRDAFKAAVTSPEFAATGKDAMAMGKRFSVEFADLG